MSYRYHDDGHKGWDPPAGGLELNGVEKDKGGTAFIPGTHKSNYRKKLNLFDERDSGIWESYSCPPGLLLIFSEGGAPHLVSMGAGRSAHGALFLL